MGRGMARPGDWCLYKRSSGIWYFYIYMEDGTRKYRSTGKRTKSEAKNVLTLYLREGSHAMSYLIFRNYAKGFYDYDKSQYIRSRLARGYSYSRKNAKNNQRALETHIMPYFRDKNIQKITRDDVNRWLLNLPKKADISNKRANDVFNLLQQILDHAVDQGFLQKNVARSVDPLNRIDSKTRKRAAYTLAQVQALFSEPWGNHHAEVGCRLAAMTGMRMGEIKALSVEQIHDDYISVDRSYSDEDGFKSTKTGWGRIVPIPKSMRADLQTIMPKSGLVFTYDGKTPWTDRVFTRPLKERMSAKGVLAPEGMSLSFHSFRHFFNTRLLANGVDETKVRAIIGHDTEEMTEHYAHLEASDFSQVAVIQESIFGMGKVL